MSLSITYKYSFCHLIANKNDSIQSYELSKLSKKTVIKIIVSISNKSNFSVFLCFDFSFNVFQKNSVTLKIHCCIKWPQNLQVKTLLYTNQSTIDIKEMLYFKKHFL